MMSMCLKSVVAYKSSKGRRERWQEYIASHDSFWARFIMLFFAVYKRAIAVVCQVLFFFLSFFFVGKMVPFFQILRTLSGFWMESQLGTIQLKLNAVTAFSQHGQIANEDILFTRGQAKKWKIVSFHSLHFHIQIWYSQILPFIIKIVQYSGVSMCNKRIFCRWLP